MKTYPVTVEHQNTIAWDEAPIPVRIHLCLAQSRAHYPGGVHVDVCRCGAYRSSLRLGGRRWIGRNSRRAAR